jgi:aubergine-like protein
MSKDDEFDFHLAAQYVNQGTCTPTHYTVAYENRKMSQEALMAFTYEQCFNYYNWEGAIRVPACLQYANKLAKLAGEGIMGDIV